MEVALIAYGSRGDVQPFVALARALRLAGQQVRLLAPPTFASLAADHDIPFAPTGADIEAHLRTRMQAIRATGNAVRLLWSLRDEMRSLVAAVAHDTWQAAQGASLVIGTGPASASIAERLRVPFIEGALQPLTPTRAFPSPVAPPWLHLGGGYNQLTHHLFEHAFWQLFRGNTNSLRTRVHWINIWAGEGAAREGYSAGRAWNTIQTAALGPVDGQPSLRPLRAHGPYRWIGRPGHPDPGLLSALANLAVAALLWALEDELRCIKNWRPSAMASPPQPAAGSGSRCLARCG